MPCNVVTKSGVSPQTVFVPCDQRPLFPNLGDLGRVIRGIILGLGSRLWQIGSHRRSPEGHGGAQREDGQYAFVRSHLDVPPVCSLASVGAEPISRSATTQVPQNNRTQ